MSDANTDAFIGIAKYPERHLIFLNVDSEVIY